MVCGVCVIYICRMLQILILLILILILLILIISYGYWKTVCIMWILYCVNYFGVTPNLFV